MNTLQHYYELKNNRNNNLDVSSIQNFRFLFKTKKSFNDFKRSLVCTPSLFTKKFYYIDSLFDTLEQQIKCFISNDFKPCHEWYYRGFAPAFNKDVILDIWDIENEDFKFNN